MSPEPERGHAPGYRADLASLPRVGLTIEWPPSSPPAGSMSTLTAANRESGCANSPGNLQYREAQLNSPGPGLVFSVSSNLAPTQITSGVLLVRAILIEH